MNRFALVVSVCNYPSASKLAPLPGAKEDADAIMAKLKEAGFDVTPLADCTAQELRNEINELKEDLSKLKDSLVLFFFSGHGGMDEGRGSEYMVVPVGDGVGVEAVSVTTHVQDGLAASATKAIVILDMCRTKNAVQTKGAKLVDEDAAGLTSGCVPASAAGPSGQRRAQPYVLKCHATLAGRAAKETQVRDGVYHGQLTVELLKMLFTPGRNVDEAIEDAVKLVTYRGLQTPEFTWAGARDVFKFPLVLTASDTQKLPDEDVTLIQFFTHQLRHGSPDEQQVAADSLWPLTWGDQANTKMEFMVMHHVLELLADVLADGRRPFAVRHKACNIVQNLACNAKYRDRLVELGAIKSAIAIMRDAPDEGTFRAANGALFNLRHAPGGHSADLIYWNITELAASVLHVRPWRNEETVCCELDLLHFFVDMIFKNNLDWPSEQKDVARKAILDALRTVRAAPALAASEKVKVAVQKVNAYWQLRFKEALL